MPCPQYRGKQRISFKEVLSDTLEDLRIFLLKQHHTELSWYLRENQQLHQQLGEKFSGSEASLIDLDVPDLALKPIRKVTRFGESPETQCYSSEGAFHYESVDVQDSPAMAHDVSGSSRVTFAPPVTTPTLRPTVPSRGTIAKSRLLQRGDSTLSATVSPSMSIVMSKNSVASVSLNQRSTLISNYLSDGPLRSTLASSYFNDGLLNDLVAMQEKRNVGAFFWVRNIWCAFLEFGNHDSSLLDLAKLSDATESNSSGVDTCQLGEASLARGNTQLSTQSYLQARRFKCMDGFLISPTSKIRMTWVLLSLTFLAYDFFVLPVDAVFAKDDSDSNELSDVMMFLARIFWTLDILMSFLTGYYTDGLLIMDAGIIAWEYMKSWFVFDLCLVSMEWFLMAMETSSETATISMFRGVRWSRIARLARLVRFARLIKLRTMAMDLFAMTSDAVIAMMTLLKTVVLIVAFVHLGACLWAVLGNVDDGWVHSNDMVGDTTFRKYSIALHWLVISLQGSRIPFISVRRTSEIFIDSLLLLASLLLQSLLISTVTQVVFIHTDSNDMVMVRRNANKYLRTHKITPHTMVRTRRYLQNTNGEGPSELFSFERKLFKVLPGQLQEDLNYELRYRPFCNVGGFGILHDLTPRIMRHLCNEMFSKLVMADESVFSKGDACTSLHMVRAGLFHYISKEATLLVTPRYAAFPRCRGPKNTDILEIGQCVSEAALWTEWENFGELVAKDNEGLLIVLDADTLAAVTIQYKVGRAHAVKYAQHFVWKLNRCAFCDVTGFDFHLEDLEEPLYEGSTEDHFIFLSHYKVEAGTEATLMRDLMLKTIRDDPTHEGNDLMTPVFIDSEDLVDLAKLRAHCQGSVNLVVLLTPGYLTRPWCLLEIVTAVRSDCRLVPVEVQRPGIKYTYPDDDWYADLRDGKILTDVDVSLLTREGITLEEVEDAIRKTFTTIALPFSPHKSGNIRTAELEDIMKRCRGGGTGGTMSRNTLRSGSSKRSGAFGM